MQIFILILIAIFSLTVSLSKGSSSLSIDQLLLGDSGQLQAIFFDLRLPRTLAAFVAGGLLALAGALMQLLLENPLADPYALGVSGGALLFTLLMIFLGMSGDSLFFAAWLGSLFAMGLIFLLAKKHRWQTHALLLAGIALACGFGAAISFILTITPQTHLHSMLFWLAGDLNGAIFPWWGLSVLGVGLIICYLLAPGLNILSRGEKEARVLGLPSRPYRMAIFLLSSVFTASAVTLAGSIGFIGLIVPHLTRLLFGHDHRLILPFSVLIGGSMLTLADTYARTLFAPMQIPVGIFVALIGVPVFIWMMQR